MKISCPICNKQRQCLETHLKGTHNLSEEQLLALKIFVKRVCKCGCNLEFNCLSSSTQIYICGHNMRGLRRLDSQKRLLENNPMKNHEIASKQAKLRRATQEKIFQEQPERAIAKAAKNSKASKQMWANRTKEEREEIGNKIQDSLLKVDWQRANRSRLCYTFEYAGIVFDSGYAVQFAKFCDKYEIKWCYEQVKVQIRDAAHKFRSFTPDFFLPDYGIYVEIKNDYALSILAMQQKLRIAKTFLPLLVFSDTFLNYTRDNTEPSRRGNFTEGVENRVDDLRIFNTLVSKLHERVLNRNEHLGYLILSYERKICSELTGDSKKSEIKNFDDNKMLI